MRAIDEKPHLIGLNEAQEGRKFALHSGQILIGRDAASCHIVLEQPFISRLQALLEIQPDGKVLLKNLSSRQTTFVNARAVDSCFLENGARIDFGAGQFVSFTFHLPQKRQGAAGFSNNSANKPASGFLPAAAVAAAAASAQAGGDATVYFSDSPPNATSVLQIARMDKLSIGRAADNDLILDSPGVSRHHAELIYTNGGQPMIQDLGSSNGTFINGEALREPRLLQSTDWVTIGGYLLRVSGRAVKKHDLSSSHLAAVGICKELAGKSILRDVSIAINPHEFIGLMGASGCGKSTLMDALNGLRPATSGQVLVNDLDLYRNFNSLRRSIGYVPQRDVLHDALTVERTLFYAAKLRLPIRTSAAQIAEIIGEVIHTVGLSEQRQTAFGRLSGGQQKRLSLGIELITKPSFLFLDEPTSPLDPETTENMMLLFRRLADEGRIVVMVTHKFEKFNLMHHIALLTKDGRLAFFGPPQEALQYFNCQEPGEIYRRLNERQPEEISRAFQSAPQFQKYVGGRLNEMQRQHQAGTTGAPGLEDRISPAGAERKFGFRQWLTLTERYLEIKLKDRKNTLLLLAQAPLIALVLAGITGDTPNDGRTLFIAAVIAIWLGANNAIREIVSETQIYARERLVNLKIPSYVFSKFAVLSMLGFVQCVLFVLILTYFGRFEKVDFIWLVLISYLTLLAGVSIGLFFSALVNSTEKAMSVLPLILIPQLLLSGFLKPLETSYVNLRTGKPATIADYDRYQREKKDAPQPDPKKPNEIPKLADPTDRQEGLGAARWLADLMVARWTMEALTHQVGISDPDARDKLAGSMTVAEYRTVSEKGSEAEIVESYRERVRFDLLVLGGFGLFFLVLAIMVLKRKDSL